MHILTAGGVNEPTIVEVIITMHQHYYHCKENTTHYSGQVEHSDNVVDNKSIKVGGKNHIITNYNCMITIIIKNGLPRMPLNHYNGQEWLTLPH